VTLPHPDPQRRVELALNVYHARLAQVEAIESRLKRCAGCDEADALPFDLQHDHDLLAAERRLSIARERLRRLKEGARRRR
jgi:hypothetical protein